VGSLSKVRCVFVCGLAACDAPSSAELSDLLAPMQRLQAYREGLLPDPIDDSFDEYDEDEDDDEDDEDDENAEEYDANASLFGAGNGDGDELGGNSDHDDSNDDENNDGEEFGEAFGVGEDGEDVDEDEDEDEEKEEEDFDDEDDYAYGSNNGVTSVFGELREPDVDTVLRAIGWASSSSSSSGGGGGGGGDGGIGSIVARSSSDGRNGNSGGLGGADEEEEEENDTLLGVGMGMRGEGRWRDDDVTDAHGKRALLFPQHNLYARRSPRR
jgi:hypothetical protein